MDAKIFKRALEKATYDSTIREIALESDGITGIISVVGVGNDRIAHVEFPFPLKGEWGIGDPKKVIKSLSKIDGELKIEESDNMFILRGTKKRYKFPIMDGVCELRTKLPFTPRCEGSKIYFGEKVAAEITVKFRPSSIKELKNAIKSEQVYKEEAHVMFSGAMNVSGSDETEFSAGDTIEGTFESGVESVTQGIYTGLNDMIGVLGNDDVTICTADDSLFYVEETDGDIRAIYIILPIIKS